MAGSGSGATTPSGSNTLSAEGIGDEREFDRLPSMIPDSQPNPNFAPPKPSPKLFSAAKEDVSESVLAQGFTFPVKAPPRPGQFSQRPDQLAPKLSQVTPQRPIAALVSLEDHPSSVKKENQKTETRRLGQPFDLPELGLPAVVSSSSEFLKQEHIAKLPTPTRQLPFSFGPSPQNSSTLNPTQTTSRSPAAVGKDLHRPVRPSPPEYESETNRKSFVKPENGGPIQVSLQALRSPGQLRGSGYSKHVLVRAAQGNGGSNLKALKLPPPHVTQVMRAQSRTSKLSSICGDLERPLPQTPRNNCWTSSIRPLSNPRDDAIAADSLHRSQSRASNISRKRSGLDSRCSQRDEERETMAMRNVAGSWNNYMQTIQEQRDKFRLDIKQLKKDIRRQEKKLADSNQLVTLKNTEIEQTEARYKDLADQEHQVKTENQRLNDEVKVLQDEVDELKKQAKDFVERSHIYKVKLNQAIKEQQELFDRTSEMYRECQAELQKEKDHRASQTLEVDKALQHSLKKREELKECFRQFRNEAEQGLQKSADVIAQLEAKIEEREAEIARERDAANHLRHCVDEQTKVDESINSLKAEVERLVSVSSKREKQDQEKEKVASELSSKLDLIMEQLQSATNDTSPHIDLEATIKNVEKNILERVLPLLLTGMSVQSKARHGISELRTEIAAEFKSVKNSINDQNSTSLANQMTQDTSQQKILALLEELGVETTEARQLCESTERQITRMADCQIEMQRKTESFLQTEMTRQLKMRESEISERESKIQDLQRALQMLTDDYASKTVAMGNSMLESNERTTKQLEETLVAIHMVLDEALAAEGAGAAQNLVQSNKKCAELQAQLKDVEEQLAVANNTLKNTKASNIRKALNEERETVVILKDKLTQYELAAKESNGLRDRWLRDMKTITAIKEQLKKLGQRFSQFQAVGSEFQAALEMNQAMEETASYLSEERRWVQEQLELRVPSHEITDPSPLPISEPSQNEVEDLSIGHIQVSSNVGGEEELLPESELKTIQADIRRRVLVHSPSIGAGSPSPPMSVEEEQLRRREGVTPRSILKPSYPSAQESSLENLPSKVAANHSQYNKPVTSQSDEASRNALVEQIRSGFIQPQEQWRLITVSEYQKTSEQDSSRSSSMSKRQFDEDVTHTRESSSKRVKRVRREMNARQRSK